MPTYTITDPNTGRKVKITGDSEPTEQELDDIFSSPEISKTEPKQKMEEQNVVGQTFNVPGAAVRSFLQGKGYAEGALNPSKVENFQDIAIRKAQFTTSPVINAVIGLPASAAGMAADILTNPADVLAMAVPALKPIQALGKVIAGTKVAKAVEGVVNAKIAPMKWVKDAFSGINRVKKASELSKESVIAKTAEQVAGVRSEGSKMKSVVSTLARKQKEAVGSEVDGIAKALESAEKVYSGKIADTAFTKSSEVRKELPSLFKAKSEEYGIGRDKILLENPATATKSEVIPSIEESLLNHGILGTDESGKIMIRRSAASKPEKVILDEYLRLRQLPDDAVINASELVTSQSLIRPKFGKTWNPSDHLQAEVSEGISDILAVKIPKLAEYRKNYAPFLEWKKAVIKEFQPFAGKFANKKGTQVLSKYADVNKRLTQDEVRLMSELEKQTGKDFTSQLKNIRGLGKDIKARKENIKSTSIVKGKEVDDAIASKKAAIDDLISSRIESLKNKESLDINSINDEARDIIDGLKRRRLIIAGVAAATAGSAFLKYVKNRMTYGLFGITGE